MLTREINCEVLYLQDRIIRISGDEIAGLKRRAAANPRNRVRLCAHRDPGDAVHEMLIAVGRGCYLRPHRHLAKSESFHVIDGEADVVLFDDSGGVTEIIPLGDYASAKTVYYRLFDQCFHALLIRSEFFLYHETTSGPFDPSETLFPAWAPDGADPALAAAYLHDLSRRISRP